MERGPLLEVKASIRSLIMSTNYKMNIQDLQRDYQKFMGKPLPYLSLGFQSAEHLLHYLPDVVKVIGAGPQALVQYIPNEKSEHIADLVKHQRIPSNKTLKKVVKPRKRATRAYAHDFSLSEESNKNYGTIDDKGTMHKRNPISSSSISSSYDSDKTDKKHPMRVKQLCRRTPNRIHIGNIEKDKAEAETLNKSQTNNCQDSIKMEKRKHKVLNTRFNIVSSSDDDEPDHDLALKPDKYLMNTMQSSESTNVKSGISNCRLGTRSYFIREDLNHQIEAIPKNAVSEIIANMGLDKLKIQDSPPISEPFKIPRCELYDELEEGSIISLYISEIHSPLVFFFHIDKEDHELLKLERGMREMYFKLAPNDLCISDSYLRAGRFCAALDGKTWYRAQILNVPTFLNDFSKIKLIFIDYGCICLLPKKHLKELCSKFCVPVQAACGRLSYIEPNERARSADASKYFTAIAIDRCLYAYVKKIDKDKSIFDVILVDTNVTPKLNINKNLIESGFVDNIEVQMH